MTLKTQRKQLLVDREVQGSLMTKAAFYWLLSLAVVAALNVLGWIFVSPGGDLLAELRRELPSVFAMWIVAALSSLVVLPVLLYDLARHSNRFAGPIYRLQRAMRAVADGKTIQPVVFREGDYWHDMADSFNQIVTRLEIAEQRAGDADFVEFETVAPVDQRGY